MATTKKLPGAPGGGTTANHTSIVDTISRWFKRADLPREGGASGLPRTCKGLFTHITQALNFDDTGPEERRVTKTIISDPVVDLRALPGCAKGISMGNLTGGMHMADLKTLAGGAQCARPGSPVEASQEEDARE